MYKYVPRKWSDSITLMQFESSRFHFSAIELLCKHSFEIFAEVFEKFQQKFGLGEELKQMFANRDVVNMHITNWMTEEVACP